MNRFFAAFFLILLSATAFADKKADESYIQMLADAGLITGTSIQDGEAVLFVTNEFHDSDYKSKDSVTGVVLRYYRADNKSIESLLLVDSSGKKIGVRNKNALTLY